MEEPVTKFMGINTWSGATGFGPGLQKVTLPGKYEDLCISCHRYLKMANQDICEECDHAADQWRDIDELTQAIEQ